MTTLFDCALNGILLSSLNERICVLDIREDAPKLRTTALSLHPEGQHLLRQVRESLTLHVDFALHEEDPILRCKAMQTIHAWAVKGGMLTITSRAGQRLPVICADLPSLSGEDWTEKCTLTFQSTRVPYWEDANATTAAGSEVLTLNVPGTVESVPVDVLVINNTDETINRLTVRAGSTQMVFEGLVFEPGSMFLLIQSDGPLLAQIDGDSVLHCRTANSADQLLAPCGKNCTAYASASAPLQASFTVRGRYA